jgi:hypothetical protein
MKKLRLHVENLRVESFQTSEVAPRSAGTVQGHADDCTWFVSCLCKTAYYNCGTGPHTIYSCNYTHDDRCRVTSWEQCATPPEL